MSAAAAAGAHSGPTTSTGDTAVDPGPSPIAVHTEGSTVVLAVVDRLDEVAGGALLDAASQAVASDPERIEVDLRALESYTPAGARALVGCRDLGARVPEGLHYRTGRGPGRDALMAAYDDTAGGPAPI
jgi:hypothetical protein